MGAVRRVKEGIDAMGGGLQIRMMLGEPRKINKGCVA